MNANFMKFIDSAILYMDYVEKDQIFEEARTFIDTLEIKEILNKENVQMEKLRDFLKSNLSFLNNYMQSYYGAVQDYQPEDIEKASKILLTLKYWFIEAVEKIDEKLFLLFIYTLSFLNVDFLKIIDFSTVDNDKAESISNFIVDLLMKVKKTTIMPEDTLYHEKQIFLEYEEGLKINDFSKIYYMIDATERGIGFMDDSIIIIQSLIKVLCLIDKNKFCSVLNAGTDPIMTLLFLKPLSIDEKLHMGTNYILHNKWALFEIIRQSINNNKSISLSEEAIKSLSRIVEKLGIIDIDFFTYSTKHFEYSIEYFMALGHALPKMEDQFLNSFTDSIVMSKHSNNYDTICKFFEYFCESKNEIKIRALCERVYEKWEFYLNSLITEKIYLLDMPLTDYFDIVVSHKLNNHETKNDLAQSLKSLIKMIIEINTEWQEKFSETQTMFYIRLSKLYLLSVVWNQKQYTFEGFEDLQNNIFRFLDDRRIWITFFRNCNIPNPIKGIKMNFSR